MSKLRKINVTLECFVKRGNKYLMLERDSNKRIMPNVLMACGGKREFNEGLFEAARREVKEETGLNIKNLRIKAVGNAYLEDLEEEFYFHFIFADYNNGTLIKNMPEGKLIWMTIEEILNHPNLLKKKKKIGKDLFDEKNSKIISYKAIYEKGNKLKYFEIEK